MRRGLRGQERCSPAIRCATGCAPSPTRRIRRSTTTVRSGSSSSAAARARAPSPTSCRRRSPNCPPSFAHRLRVDAAVPRRRTSTASPRPTGRPRSTSSSQSFFDDLPERMAQSHLVISRARAPRPSPSSRSSAGPRSCVPLPGSIDADQKNNALVVEAAGGGWIAEQATLSPQSLGTRLASLFGDPETLQARSGSRQIPGTAEGSRKARRPRREAGGQGEHHMKMPRNIGPVHFVGIGGIGMSGIAEILHNQGYVVRGSDSAESANVQRLRDMGIDVDDRPARREPARTPRSSSSRRRSRRAIRSSPRPARAACRWCAAPKCSPRSCGSRTAIAIGGTHGKTTTTTLVATLLDAGELRPDRHQRRHHQCLRHQRAPRRRRVDGGRGRRERRHVRQAAGRCRDRHQHRSRASRPLSATSTA